VSPRFAEQLSKTLVSSKNILPSYVAKTFDKYLITTEIFAFLSIQNKRQIELSYPRFIKDLHGVPNDIDGAFTNTTDDSVYFIKGRRLWRMDERLRVTESDSIGVKWFGCPKPESERQPEVGLNSTGQLHGKAQCLRCNVTLFVFCILACFAKLKVTDFLLTFL